MADKAHEKTDEILAELEARLKVMYEQAEKEMRQKWHDYMKRSKDKLDTLYSAYSSAPPDKKAEALAAYQDALQKQIYHNEYFSDMVNQLTYRLAHTNEMAIAYVKGDLADVYMINYNQPVPGIEDVGIKFNLIDESTLKNLVKSGEIQLPDKTLNYYKDMAWNRRQIYNDILQGILQGESINSITKRLIPHVIGNNKSAARRMARTLITGAQNRGRLDRYKYLEDEGAIMHKVWIATPDGRTRDWHLDMDGQEVPTDEPFIDGHGNELDYPGDPGAEPETVYNCRCTMRSVFIGYKGKGGKIQYMPRHEHNGLHQEQMEKEKKRREG